MSDRTMLGYRYECSACDNTYAEGMIGTGRGCPECGSNPVRVGAIYTDGTETTPPEPVQATSEESDTTPNQNEDEGADSSETTVEKVHRRYVSGEINEVELESELERLLQESEDDTDTSETKSGPPLYQSVILTIAVFSTMALVFAETVGLLVLQPVDIFSPLLLAGIALWGCDEIEEKWNR